MAIALLIIGIVVLAGTLYFLFKEKNDPESRKIYTVIALISAAVVIGSLIALIA